MRILIADDERLARSSLRSMLDELGLPLEIVGEAADGEEMVELVRRHLPEAVFVDIHMPRLNGLEAIRAARMASPRTTWYILTGYPEFEYAREAIRLGVSQYLLKPVDPQELRRLLLAAIEEHGRAAAERNRQFEHDITALYHGLSSLAQEGEDSIIRTWHSRGALFCLDSHLPEGTVAERQLGFCRAIQRRIGQMADPHVRLALFALPSGDLATVGAWEPAHAARSRPLVEAYLRAAEQAARRAGDRDLAVTTLASEECSSFQALQGQWEELQRLAPLRAMCGVGGMVASGVLREAATREGWLEFARLLAGACRCYRERAYLRYVRALQQCTGLLSGTDLAGLGAHKGALAGFIYCSTACRVPPDQGLEAWIRALEEHGERMLRQGPGDERHGTDTIAEVLSYVDQHYTEDIGIGQIAEQLHITPNYLSTLFHRRTGTTFMVYLTRARMLRAKELLANPSAQVQQVAQQVGYPSARYFAKLFTQFAGCHPSEYRARLCMRGASHDGPAAGDGS